MGLLYLTNARPCYDDTDDDRPRSLPDGGGGAPPGTRWASALLARVTDDPSYRELMRTVALHLAATQAADGGWLDGQSPITRLD